MSAADERRLAWAYLSTVGQGASRSLSAAIGEHGVVEVAEAVRQGGAGGRLSSRLAARAHLDTAAEDLGRLARSGGRLVTPDDEEWPAWHLLGFELLTTTVDADAPPLALWVWGERRIDELTDRSVGIVGTRAASGYGEHVTAQVAGDLAVDGWTVVSGAAFGVDAAAHRAALGVGGTTLAVLACGVDRAYPAAHSALLRSVSEAGLVVSEYPPGTTPARYRFLARNRLIAALSAGTVVVEAGWRSGARNTATWARRLGKPVMAVPGPVTSASSQGCHRMIREGEARLVGSAHEVVEECGPVLGRDDGRDALFRRDLDGLSRESSLVYEAFPATGSCTPSVLAESAGVPVEQVRAALSLLELDGLVVLVDGGWRRA
ncbi:DNA-processing protein DprA [Rhodococcus coprophilus]|uniref:DNA processing protein n=1 Tax=Rhodococcus coprophilus TaxID=38310 RepID=A0A2X4TPS9_9NOCA|nr:DNA-processing protein DprA [Rhodococcus coprophilus]MBM7461424.1 DNA processing protein [Rhodococcus coprophilus]SQI29406.1 DNA processing protein [Rhodococcus coprophilus]